MAEEVKRGLRPKRPPRYRASDEQDPEHASYARPNYAKITSTTHTHEYMSPSVVLNQNAKILVKFINKSNKSTHLLTEDLRDMRLMREESERELAKKESHPKDKMSIQPAQIPKKQTSTSRNQKTQPPKKNKQLYNFKGLHQNGQLLKNITQEQVLKGVKGMESLSSLINNISNKGIYSKQVSNQLSQLQSLYPNLKDLNNIETLTQSPNPNLFQFNQQTTPQPVARLPTGQLPTQTPQSQKSINEPSRQSAKQSKSQPKRPEENVGAQKIFKRSAYHVAIAYHIYLKGLYEQGITSGNLIDPTYKARLVKEQSGMAGDDEL